MDTELAGQWQEEYERLTGRRPVVLITYGVEAHEFALDALGGLPPRTVIWFLSEALAETLRMVGAERAAYEALLDLLERMADSVPSRN